MASKFAIIVSLLSGANYAAWAKFGVLAVMQSIYDDGIVGMDSLPPGPSGPNA